MTNKEYDKAKEECWKVVKKELDLHYWGGPTLDIVSHTFDYAYALGKQETKQETNSSKNENTSNYSGNHFADVRKMADTRLNIAAMAMAGALANKNVTIGRGDFEDSQEYISKTALMYADALIAECEKGGTK